MPHVDISFELMGESAACIQARPAAGFNLVAPDLQLQRKIWQVAQNLRQEYDCLDIVPGMNNLTVIFDPTQEVGEIWLERLRKHWQHAPSNQFTQREVTIPVQYGGLHGPDLELVAEHCELSTDAVVRLHSESIYTVYFLGFQPGFAYMGGMPQRLNAPRRAEPRLLVPAGTVAIGGSQTGIYPTQSPGGWQLIAWTPENLFDPMKSTPCLLGPGDLVHFKVENIYV